jgi:hypothetical protein
MRKQKKLKRRPLACSVAVEISREQLTMVIVDKKKEDQPREVRAFRSRWLRESASLNSEQGSQELTSALSELVEQLKLAGGTVNVALSSDFCVTRVVAGETDKMLSEMNHLRERSAHYLSLGAGPKATSESIRSLDMKNSQGWLTVTNRETLDQIVQACGDAGLFVGLIEHSMVAISRAVGRMGGDAASPAIVIEPREDGGVDLGVSYRGQLLFAYRPGGICSKGHIGEIVERHLERIQRYSTRFFRFASGQISRVYLVGAYEDAELVRGQFANSTRLTAEIINPALVCPDWRYEEALVFNPNFVAPLGSALIEPETAAVPPRERDFPNLMDVYRSGYNEPLWPGVRRHLWPIAAAAAAGLVMYGGALLQHRQAVAVEQELAAAEAKAALATTLKLELEHTVSRLKYLSVLDADVVNPPLHQLMAHVVRNKPSGVYLNKISLDAECNVLFLGTADSTDLIYDFETRLKSVPLLDNLAIAGMTPERIPSNENATGFQIKCKFAGFNGSAERVKGNG